MNKVRETQDAMLTHLVQPVTDYVSLISASLFDPVLSLLKYANTDTH